MRNALAAPVLIFTWLAAFALLGSCTPNIRDELDRTVEKYNDLIRWNELGTASIFASERIRQEFITRAESQRNVRVIDYKIISVRYDEKLNKATVDVSIQYYLLTTLKAKRVLYSEDWVYVEEQGVKGWKLTSPIPEFTEN